MDVKHIQVFLAEKRRWVSERADRLFPRVLPVVEQGRPVEDLADDEGATELLDIGEGTDSREPVRPNVVTLGCRGLPLGGDDPSLPVRSRRCSRSSSLPE